MPEFANIASKLLIVLGLLFVLLGLVSALREEFGARPDGEGGHHESLGEAAKLVEQIRKSPRWLAMVMVGIVVIVCGSALETDYLKRLLAPAELSDAAPSTTEGIGQTLGRALAPAVGQAIGKR
jgi:uncharacterized membrane protein